MAVGEAEREARREERAAEEAKSYEVRMEERRQREQERLEALKAAILTEFPAAQIHAQRLDVKDLEAVKKMPLNLACRILRWMTSGKA